MWKKGFVGRVPLYTPSMVQQLDIETSVLWVTTSTNRVVLIIVGTTSFGRWVQHESERPTSHNSLILRIADTAWSENLKSKESDGLGGHICLRIWFAPAECLWTRLRSRRSADTLRRTRLPDGKADSIVAIVPHSRCGDWSLGSRAFRSELHSKVARPFK